MDRKEYGKEWRKKNPNYQREWRKEHPEYQKEWLDKNPLIRYMRNNQGRNELICSKCGCKEIIIKGKNGTKTRHSVG